MTTEAGDFIEEFLEDFLEDSPEIQHKNDKYDPVKRREYYLRTRKLKGRTKGDAPTRLKTQQEKLKAARDKMSRLPPGKQQKTRVKLDALENKINNALSKYDRAKRRVGRVDDDVKNKVNSTRRNVERAAAAKKKAAARKAGGAVAGGARDAVAARRAVERKANQVSAARKKSERDARAAQKRARDKVTATKKAATRKTGGTIAGGVRDAVSARRKINREIDKLQKVKFQSPVRSPIK